MPSATTTAPVSVARSIISSGLICFDRVGERVRAASGAPSASVLPISIGEPVHGAHDVAGRCAVPDGMFSVAAIRPCTSTGSLSSGSAWKMPEHRGRARHVVLHPAACRRPVLRSSPPESKRDALADDGHAPARAALRACSVRWMNFGGSSLPWATPT